MWTRFMDMHSGGGLKEKWQFIIIEAPENEATVIFYNRFGHSPRRVTCTCCGGDYSVSESPTLEDATAYDRGCAFHYFDKKSGKDLGPVSAIYDHKKNDWCVAGRPAIGKYVEVGHNKYGKKYLTLKQYLRSGEVFVIREGEIKPDERRGSVPEQGYVWAG
jgi:hypothetical protein